MFDDDDIYDESSFQEWDSSNYDEYDDDDEDRLADYIYQEDEKEEW